MSDLFKWASSQPEAPKPQCRLDRDLTLLSDLITAEPPEMQSILMGSRAIQVIEILSRLRGLEMSEEEATGHAPPDAIATAYESLTQPGGPLVQTLSCFALDVIAGVARPIPCPPKAS